VSRRLAPLLMSYVKAGSPKQAKYAIRCIDAVCRSKDVIFKQLFEVRLLMFLYHQTSAACCRHSDFNHENVVVLLVICCV